MKVLQVMASAGEGGLEKHLVDLANGLCQRGIHVAVCANPMYRDRFASEVEFIPFDFSGSRRNPLLLTRLLFTLRRAHADIIHAQANKAGQILATLSPLLKAKTVTTVHNIKKRLHHAAAMDLVIGVSKTVSAQVGNNCLTVYNGIAVPDVPATAPCQTPAATPDNWLAVGRLVKAKGFDVLIQAFREVPGTLKIAGEGPERPLLEQLIKQYDLSNRVSLLGHREDVPDLMHAADAVVISSRREGFSYVFSEALLCETPLVSTDVPVPNEILPAALIAPVEDPAALAQVMSACNQRPEHHRQAQAFARCELTLDAMVDKTLQAYRRLLPS
ncbi:glycosyltransferase [Marinobacterium marinum]|uniref:Glycosyltransferase n=1 Tax=Marinobacterium marinum TaxID=2756129 RepID=A0A7W2AC64_9GAMM|nr:glycosyltransferase [Marinobacterium marinum]MBA4503636.1 glycosyltransferase [Marinobacterium marinum]